MPWFWELGHLNRDPTSASSVNNSSQTVPQLCASQQATTSQPQCLVDRSGQLQEQGFSVEVAEKIAAPQRSSTGTIYKSSGPYLEMVQRKFGGLLHSLCERSLRFFRVPIPSSNRLPSTIDSYRTTIVNTLDPGGHHILQAQMLTGYSPVFSGIIPKFQESSKMEPFLSCLLSSHKHPLTLLKTQSSHIFSLKLLFASFGLRQVPQRSPCLGCKQVSNLGQWEKVTLFPSSDFIAKN